MMVFCFWDLLTFSQHKGSKILKSYLYFERINNVSRFWGRVLFCKQQFYFCNISLFYEWSKFPFQKRSTYYLFDCLSRWFGSTKCKLHKQLYQNAQTKLRRHCLEKKKSKPTPPPHQRCTTTALCLQYKRLRKKGLHCAWCDVREFKYRSNSDDYQDLLFEWKLMPCNSSCHNGFKTFLNSHFKLLFCLTFQNFSWIFNLKCKEKFRNIPFSMRLKNF